MTKRDMRQKVGELVDLRRRANDLCQEVNALEDELKACMLRNDLEEVEAGDYHVRYTVVVNNRFDTAAFRRANPGLYSDYTKPTECRRLTIHA